MIEKTEVQFDSFQKEFGLFLKSGNVLERVTAFKDIVRSVFQPEDLQLVYKLKFDADWEELSLIQKLNTRDLSISGVKLNLSTEYFDEKNYNESIILALSDSSFIGILLNDNTFSETDRITLHLLLRVLENESNSHISQKKEKELIFSLNEKILQLNNLIDTGIELSKFDRRDILFELALERACALLNASSACLRIVDKKKHITHEYVFPSEAETSSILSNKYKIDSSFEFNNRNYILSLSEKETRRGSTSFSDLDLVLLDAICKQIFVVIENEFLQQQIILKQRYEQELTVAASIQQRIIPDKLPLINSYDIAGINIPSREVGGDYYDCINLGKGKYAFIIADVSGKGIAAALLVNTLNAALYSYLEFDLPQSEITSRLNKLIYNSSPPDKFITYFIAVLDTETGTLDAVNAGHNPILLLRKDGSLEMIDAGGVGLGMFNLGIPYMGQKMILNPGDKLFLYTDGIPEAMDIDQNEYSDERMINYIKSHSDLSANEMIRGIVDDVKLHSGAAEQSDDITALYVIRKQ